MPDSGNGRYTTVPTITGRNELHTHSNDNALLARLDDNDDDDDKWFLMECTLSVSLELIQVSLEIGDFDKNISSSLN